MCKKANETWSDAAKHREAEYFLDVCGQLYP